MATYWFVPCVMTAYRGIRLLQLELSAERGTTEGCGKRLPCSLHQPFCSRRLPHFLQQPLAVAVFTNAVLQLGYLQPD